MRRYLVLSTFVVAAICLPMAAHAQITACGDAAAPLCDGACPVGQDCEEQMDACECQPTTDPCGVDEGPPLCYGECPPSDPICADIAGVCQCVPTLSEWGILGMSLVMLGGVAYRRRLALRS